MAVVGCRSRACRQMSRVRECARRSVLRCFRGSWRHCRGYLLAHGFLDHGPAHGFLDHSLAHGLLRGDLLDYLLLGGGSLSCSFRHVLRPYHFARIQARVLRALQERERRYIRFDSTQEITHARNSRDKMTIELSCAYRRHCGGSDEAGEQRAASSVAASIAPIGASARCLTKVVISLSRLDFQAFPRIKTFGARACRHAPTPRTTNETLRGRRSRRVRRRVKSKRSARARQSNFSRVSGRIFVATRRICNGSRA